jgi:hypothetical protein
MGLEDKHGPECSGIPETGNSMHKSAAEILLSLVTVVLFYGPDGYYTEVTSILQERRRQKCASF